MEFAVAFLKIACAAFEQIDFFAQLVGGKTGRNFQRLELIKLDEIAKAEGIRHFAWVVFHATGEKRDRQQDKPGGYCRKKAAAWFCHKVFEIRKLISGENLRNKLRREGSKVKGNCVTKILLIVLLPMVLPF